MQSTIKFPQSIKVNLLPNDTEGLAVNLCFEASKKNNFNYILFVDSNGRAEASGNELLRTFDEDRQMFLMDYEDPRLVFTGNISAKVLSKGEIDQAVSALSIYRTVCKYPANYEANLTRAKNVRRDEQSYRVVLEISE
jgi:hypothetical protein